MYLAWYHDVFLICNDTQAVGVHANTVTQVDLRSLHLTHVHFGPIMAALSVLPVESLMISGQSICVYLPKLFGISRVY